jgi:hypothetical protein
MAEVQIKWVEKRQFVGIDSTRHSVVISGTGPEDGVGMKPAELLLIALGACSAFDVLDILEKKRQKVTGLEVRVHGEQDPEPPWGLPSHPRDVSGPGPRALLEGGGGRGAPFGGEILLRQRYGPAGWPRSPPHHRARGGRGMRTTSRAQLRR